MNQSNKLLSDIIVYRSYAKYLQHASRRESFEEIINRNLYMHLERFGSLNKNLSKDIIKAYGLVHQGKILPSLRSLQFGGEPININPARIFNCSFLAIDDIRAFDETLFLLLSGVGVGFSVRQKDISKLPKVLGPKEEAVFVIPDSVEGWCMALQLLVESYFLKRIKPVFDFSHIRPAGSIVNKISAIAPGPEPLKHMLSLVKNILKKAVGRRLYSIEVHDLICCIADCVLSGGIRRAALISLFDKDDNLMLTAKHGNWWDKYPWRARANNSAVLLRQEIKKSDFENIYEMCRKSNCGEPGIFFSNDENMGTNACAEISLNSQQFCNLSVLSLTDVKDKKDFLNRVYNATLLGSLQSAYTDFSWLRQSWKEITDKEALLGVSITGICDRPDIGREWLEEGAKLAIETNEKYAKIIGTNLAARVTTNKPDGTSSCVFGSSSGIHARHSDFYLRRVRMNKSDPLAQYLQSIIPDFVEDDKFSSSGVVVTIPQTSPKNSINRNNETAIKLFERAIEYNKYWIKPGHRYGDNRNNVSCTISVKENEWDELKECMWEHRNEYNAISLLPFDGGNYIQAPFEEITEDEFNRLFAKIPEIDLSKVYEDRNNTKQIETLACGNGACEII